MEGNSRPILRRFVVFEGLDGAGTTTQLHLLDARLAKDGIAHWVTSEPSPLPTGRLVRQVLKGEVDARPETLARLFSADRHEHLYGPHGIVERLGRGELVVSDRYILSSLAYQGVSCGPDLPHMLNAAFPLPELLVFFDIQTRIAMDRLASRSEREIFETHPVQEQVQAAYEESLSEFAGSGMKIVRIDASKSVAEVTKAISEAVSPLIDSLADFHQTAERD
jgi:dTMP kinase